MAVIFFVTLHTIFCDVHFLGSSLHSFVCFDDVPHTNNFAFWKNFFLCSNNLTSPWTLS